MMEFDDIRTPQVFAPSITELLAIKPTDRTASQQDQIDAYAVRKTELDRYESHANDEEPPLEEEVLNALPRKRSPFNAPKSKKEAKLRLASLRARSAWIGRFRNHVLEDGQRGYYQARSEYQARRARLSSLNKEDRAIASRITRLEAWSKANKR